jgi:hypothetical protein
VAGDEEWEAAGRWDVRHGLMPMRLYNLTPAERAAYLRGYRTGGFGIGVNNHRDARRPVEREADD